MSLFSSFYLSSYLKKIRRYKYVYMHINVHMHLLYLEKAKKEKKNVFASLQILAIGQVVYTLRYAGLPEFTLVGGAAVRR